MLPDLALSNTLLGYGTLLLNLATIPLLYLAATSNGFQSARTLVARWGMLAAFILTLGASVTTLYYSEYLGEAPCGLCWFERVLLYPQVILFGIALWRKDAGVWIYAAALSLIGAVIALYHHYLQMGGMEALPCPTVGTGAVCSVRTMFELGYITYPLMAVSLFVFILLLAVLRSKIKT